MNIFRNGFLGSWLIFIGLALGGCYKSSSLTRRNLPVSKNQSITVEQIITLEATRLGVSTLITNLQVPWEITWGPDNQIWCTEQDGTISKIDPATGKRKILIKIPDVYRKRLGLLSMAIHPQFKKQPHVFVNYTYLKKDSIYSKLVRYVYANDALSQPKILLEYPAYYGHMGSRVVISPDNKIMWATGDGIEAKNAQDLKSFNGKVLRLNLDGTIPADNPMKHSPVWASGFRVPQGMVYNPNGILYTAEHGDATDDEVNLIQKGNNYGWPQVQGFIDLPAEKAYHNNQAITEPLKAWTPTIAPAGLTFYKATTIPEFNNALLLVTLKENDLRVLKLNKAGTAIESEKILLDQQYGRLRAVCVSPAGDIYVSTSNRDWNPGKGYPLSADDRIIKIFKIEERDNIQLTAASNLGREVEPNNSTAGVALPAGQVLYEKYCASCHKPDGNGITGTFPALRGTSLVNGNAENLIQVVLQGSAGRAKKHTSDQQMPAFNFLKDEQLAEVLTYVRRTFGEKPDNVTAGQIAKFRNKN